MRKTENETQEVFTPLFHVALHNVGGSAAALIESSAEIGPNEDWDSICMGTFENVEDAVKEADRLHHKFLKIMELHQPEKIGGEVFSWFSVEMELRPNFYTLVYWPGRTICMDEVRAAAAHAQLVVQNLTSNTTQH